MAAAGWSSSQTFRKFYDKPVVINHGSFASSIFERSLALGILTRSLLLHECLGGYFDD